MAGTLQFNWNGGVGRERVRAAAERALESLRPEAQAIWTGIVPVKTGALRASWFSIVQMEGNTLVLVMGARVFYAIFVELGTVHMTPRYPLRRTAQAVAPLVMPRVLAQLRAAA